MKILVVEDNKNLAESLKTALTQENYAVDLVFDGEAAVRYLLARPTGYDLIILDVMLPGKNGLEVCHEARANKVVTPLLMLTARDTTNDKILGLDAGADDYLAKPFALEELLARVRALLRRPREAAPTILELGHIRLDSRTKKVTVLNKPISLTFREFSILEYFLRHPNQVLSRDQILSHVWEFSFDGLSNVVDVHMKNLRKKLGTYGDSLQTLRGMGYRLAI